MTTWLYLIVTMRDDATTGGHQDVNRMERSMINSRLYSTGGGDSGPPGRDEMEQADR